MKTIKTIKLNQERRLNLIAALESIYSDLDLFLDHDAINSFENDFCNRAMYNESMHKLYNLMVEVKIPNGTFKTIELVTSDFDFEIEEIEEE